MKKELKIVFRSMVALVLVGTAASGLFIYKIRYGFPVSYETEHPAIDFPAGKPAILLFSKSTGYRHSESIEAGRKVLQQMARRHGWFLYETEKGGVFNPEQLIQFEAVIFNNTTGRLLNAEQQETVSQYVESGGVLMGIHGSGDFSHNDWPWYQTNLIGASFSHHPLHPHLQAADVHIETNVDPTLTKQLPSTWNHTDEWYIYFDQPQAMQVIAYIDGNKILPNGNILLLRGRNFGMGKYQPVAWLRTVGQGKTFYTSMGHNAAVWKNANFTTLLRNAVLWSLK
jgi:type 1 glutamine amidotransferase